MKKIFFLFLSFCLVVQLYAQNATDNPAPLTKTERQQVIDSICRLLKDNYIFPEVATTMNELISSRLAKGDYNAISDPGQFAQTLTADLQSISKDKHLRVGFNPRLVKELREQASKGNDDDIPASFMEEMRMNNFGFREVKLLGGNIGYLDLRGFAGTGLAGETAIAAMNFLSNAGALIIDLRQNGGGSPTMIQLISSYLYGPEPVHLNNFYFRPTNKHTQTWTLPYVPGKRRPDMDVYILTSRRTFSAAEEFTYNLKNLKRAMIIGETTGGGAHPGGTQVATDRFTVWVPQGRAINPITNTNWEGTGVEPDIKVAAADALVTAQIKALEKLALANNKFKTRYEWELAGLKAKLEPVKIDEITLKSYTGNYGPRIISFENGSLYYQRNGNAKYKLKALDKYLFEPEGLSDFRVKFLVDQNKVTALQGLYDDGGSDVNKRE